MGLTQCLHGYRIYPLRIGSDNIINGEQEVVITFTSRHSNEREPTWNASEKECLAIVNALEHFEPYYLYDKSFKV